MQIGLELFATRYASHSFFRFILFMVHAVREMAAFSPYARQRKRHSGVLPNVLSASYLACPLPVSKGFETCLKRMFLNLDAITFSFANISCRSYEKPIFGKAFAESHNLLNNVPAHKKSDRWSDRSGCFIVCRDTGLMPHLSSTVSIRHMMMVIATL
jgi:hypothetical protein